MAEKNKPTASQRAAAAANETARAARLNPVAPAAEPTPTATPEGMPSAQPDAGAAQVQEKMDQEQEQGFRGTEVDPTPNENYTVSGVTSGAPTPETDPALAEQARNAARVGPEFGGVEGRAKQEEGK